MSDVASIPTIPNALQSATGAMHRSVRALAQDANVLARSGNLDSRDTLEALIDSRQQVLYAQAAAKLFDASDEVTKSLLDVYA